MKENKDDDQSDFRRKQKSKMSLFLIVRSITEQKYRDGEERKQLGPVMSQ